MGSIDVAVNMTVLGEKILFNLLNLSYVLPSRNPALKQSSIIGRVAILIWGLLWLNLHSIQMSLGTLSASILSEFPNFSHFIYFSHSGAATNDERSKLAGLFLCLHLLLINSSNFKICLKYLIKHVGYKLSF